MFTYTLGLGLTRQAVLFIQRRFPRQRWMFEFVILGLIPAGRHSALTISRNYLSIYPSIRLSRTRTILRILTRTKRPGSKRPRSSLSGIKLFPNKTLFFCFLFLRFIPSTPTNFSSFPSFLYLCILLPAVYILLYIYIYIYKYKYSLLAFLKLI